MNDTTFFELISKSERVHPDLEPYVEENGPLGSPMLRHPLVYSIAFRPEHAALENRKYKMTKKDVDAALADRKYGSFVFRHERPYRLNAFVKVANELKPGRYWKLLRSVWEDSENIWQNRLWWDDLWSGYDAPDRLMPFRPLCMDRAERRYLQRLPNRFTIYRGENQNHHPDYDADQIDPGMSWSLDGERARWFALRWGKGTLYTADVDRNEVIGYFGARNENEIVVSPKNIDLKLTENIAKS